MKDATLDIFKAVRAALIADSALSPEVGTRISTEWGDMLNTPFIRLHIPSAVHFEADGGIGAEHKLHVHVYTAEAGPIVVSRIAANVRAALEEASLTLDDADLWWIKYEATIKRVDPDSPLLQTARVEFTVVTTDKD